MPLMRPHYTSRRDDRAFWTSFLSEPIRHGRKSALARASCNERQSGGESETERQKEHLGEMSAQQIKLIGEVHKKGKRRVIRGKAREKS